MTDLGTLGGDYAEARGVSADGSTVVGYSDNASGQARAFLHRSRTMLDVQDWLGSVGGVCSMLSTSLEITRLHLEGAHHRPLAELGRGKSYWATGDVAGSSRSRDLMTRSGEAGATFEPWTNVLLGVGAGYARLDQQLANDGSGTTFGQYLVSEVDFLLQAFAAHERQSQHLMAQQLALPAYEQLLKAGHSFNLLDARGAISVTERAAYIGRIRNLARAVAQSYVDSRARLGFPMAPRAWAEAAMAQLEPRRAA